MSSKWIRSDCFLKDRVKVLVMSRKESIDNGFGPVLWELLGDARDKPDVLENAIHELIRQARPELSGCVLLYMEYNASIREWKFTVSHGSFPKNEIGERIPEEPLFTQESARIS